MSSISIPSLPPAGQTGGLALIAREAAPQAARITARASSPQSQRPKERAWWVGSAAVIRARG